MADQSKKGAHHWQRKANKARAAKRARHFLAEAKRKRRNVKTVNKDSEGVLNTYLTAAGKRAGIKPSN